MEESAPSATTPSEVHPEMLALVKLVSNKLTKETKSAAYANNAKYEASLWDFKIHFGQLQIQPDANRVDWHTVVTIPWLQAKLLYYFVRVNVAYHEHDNGQMKIPASVLPPMPIAPTKEQAEKDPDWLEMYEIHRKIYEETFGPR
jgi:hypothetical protein